MNIIIRADSSTNIGTGHVMRCLTLADELGKQGAAISFICRQEKGALTGLIREKGYEVHHLPADSDLESEKKLTQDILRSQPEIPDWLIIDHYEIGYSLESSIRNLVKKIMVIDDLIDKKHDCDLLLNQNYSNDEKKYTGLVPDNCVQLLGPGYALLRPQFLEARKKLRERNGTVKRIMVFMGGSDPADQTSNVIIAIKELNLPYIITDVIIGPSNSRRAEIENLISGMPNTTCHVNIDNMAEFMSSADLAIGAGGTASWERCCVGLPGIVIIVADNQTDIARSLHSKGCCINLGWYENVSLDRIKSCLDDLIKDSTQLLRISRECLSLVDGCGSGKVAACLFNN